MNALVKVTLLESVLLPEDNEKEVLSKLEAFLAAERAPKREAFIPSKIYPATMGHPGTTGYTSPVTEDPDDNTPEPPTTAEPETSTTAGPTTSRPTKPTPTSPSLG